MKITAFCVLKSVNKFPIRDFLLYLCITFQEATAVAVMGGKFNPMFN